MDKNCHEQTRQHKRDPEPGRVLRHIPPVSAAFIGGVHPQSRAKYSTQDYDHLSQPPFRYAEPKHRDFPYLGLHGPVRVKPVSCSSKAVQPNSARRVGLSRLQQFLEFQHHQREQQCRIF